MSLLWVRLYIYNPDGRKLSKILLFNRLLVIKDCSESNTAFAHIIWSDILLKESVSESQQLELFSYFIMLAWLKKTQILTYPSDCICFSSEMTLIWFCFWWAGRLLRLPLSSEQQWCSTNAMSSEELVLQQEITQCLPCLSISFKRDSIEAAAVPNSTWSFPQTSCTMTYRSEWLLLAAAANPG